MICLQRLTDETMAPGTSPAPTRPLPSSIPHPATLPPPPPPLSVTLSIYTHVSVPAPLNAALIKANKRQRFMLLCFFCFCCFHLDDVSVPGGKRLKAVLHKKIVLKYVKLRNVKQGRPWARSLFVSCVWAVSWSQLVTSVGLIWFSLVSVFLFSHLSLVCIVSTEFLVVFFTFSFFQNSIDTNKFFISPLKPVKIFSFKRNFLTVLIYFNFFP